MTGTLNVQLAVALLGAALLATSCEEPPRLSSPPKVVGWKRVAAFSGRGNLLTETFTSDTGSFRVHWEATNETAPGLGTLKVAFRSGDSGRVIMEPVDHRGVGKGTSEVSDMVRWYYLTIESTAVDWAVTIEEPIMGHSIFPSDP
jgi:hypothetical protein